jgi:hypothetical protein
VVDAVTLAVADDDGVTEPVGVRVTVRDTVEDDVTVRLAVKVGVTVGDREGVKVTDRVNVTDSVGEALSV